MSGSLAASNRSTYDEDAECILRSSAMLDVGDQLHRYTADGAATQQQQQPHGVSRSATDTMTMGQAVRIPHALQSATRRTMLDVLGHLRGKEGTRAGRDSCSEEPVAQRLPRDRVTASDANRNATAVNSAAPPTNPYSTNTNAAVSITHQPDLTRSLRHLLPSRRVDATRAEEQSGEEYDAISDFDDNEEEGLKGDTARQAPRWPSVNEQSRASRQYQRRLSPPVTLENEETGKTSRQRTWAKLFDCEEMHEGKKVPSPRNGHTAVLSTQKCAPMPRASTKSSRRSASSLHGLWADGEEAPRPSSGGRTSLATILDAAEARDDEAWAQSTAAAVGRDVGRRCFVDVFAAEDEEDSYLLPRHSLGKAALSAMLQGHARRSGGRSGMSAALKPLSDNLTSARVVAYLVRSFEEWKLDGAAVRRTTEAGATESLETSGVQLKLLVTMLDCAFSLYCVRGEIVWMEAETAKELHGCGTAAPSLEQQQLDAVVDGVTVLNDSWTVVLTAASFRSTPIVAGEHLYLARPFFCYPSIRVIVASLNITSDAALQPVRRRRPREAESSQQLHDGGGGGDKELSMGTTTPDRPSRPSASLSAPSPFSAYDPFVHPPVDLFRRHAAAAGVSGTPSQGQQQQQLQRLSSAPRATMTTTTTTGTEQATAQGQISALSQEAVPLDAVGANFPRGPCEEWDVPLEVLLALCPPRSQSHSVAAAAESHGRSLPVAPHRASSEESSSLSSLSSLEGVDVVLSD